MQLYGLTSLLDDGEQRFVMPDVKQARHNQLHVPGGRARVRQEGGASFPACSLNVLQGSQAQAAVVSLGSRQGFRNAFRGSRETTPSSLSLSGSTIFLGGPHALRPKRQPPAVR